MKIQSVRTSVEEISLPNGTKENIQVGNHNILIHLELISLLGRLGIPMNSFLRILSITPMGEDRYATILETVDGETGRTVKIILDVSYAAPTWEQFIDVTYNLGADCDYKVIIYDESYDDSVPSSNALAIGNLVRINNRCSIPTFLVSSEKTLKSRTRKISDFEIEEEPENVEKNQKEPLPTKRQIEEAEFWVAYYWGGLCGSEFYEDDFDIDGSTSSYSVGFNLTSQVKWNAEGLFMELIPNNEHRESGGEEIQWLWKNKKGDIERKYPGSSLALENTDTGLKFLSIRIDQQPFEQCLSASPEEKIAFAHFVNFQELDFIEFVEDCLVEYSDNFKRKKSSP